MSEVFVCPTGALTQRSARDLRKAGVVVVETDDPGRCQFVRSGEIISHDDMLWATLKALQVADGYHEGNKQREQLAIELFKIVDAKRAAFFEKAAGDE